MANLKRRECVCGNLLLKAEQFCSKCKRPYTAADESPPPPTRRCPSRTCRAAVLADRPDCPHCHTPLDGSATEEMTSATAAATPISSKLPFRLRRKPGQKPMAAGAAIGLGILMILSSFVLCAVGTRPPREKDETIVVITKRGGREVGQEVRTLEAGSPESIVGVCCGGVSGLAGFLLLAMGLARHKLG